MKLFRRTPVEDPRDTRIRELKSEIKALDLLVTNAARIAERHKQEIERQQSQIADLVAIRRDLEAELETKDAFSRALNRAYDQKQAELNKAIAEVKRLDGKLVQVDCENLRLNGLLATAQEELAGLRLAVTP